MKVNWKKTIASALMAAGIFVPSAAQADVNIPLGDPGFELYNTVPHGGFAYASATPALGYTGAYRPTSPWISNPGNAGGPLDGGANNSNWMYSAAYASGGPQPSPRTGNQALHGRFHYSGQVTSKLFEAGKTYTFSVWAQADSDTVAFPFPVGSQSRIWLYIFDGSIPFEEATSLTLDRYSPIDAVNAGPADFVHRSGSDAQSQAAWQQISISYTVAPGAPEIGSPIGVALWIGGDGAVDDAALSATPEPSTVILVGAAGLTLLGVRRRS